VTVHLLAVAVWVGGLAVLVVVGAPGWRALPDGDRPTLLRQILPRFSRIAVAAVALVVASGTVNAILELATPGDLWRLTYGRVILAKIALLGLALVLAARHRWVVPRRLAPAGDVPPPPGVAASFERTSRWEAVVLALTVAVTAGLVVLIPGRTIALAASGPVNQTARTAGYTVQLYIDPTAVGANEFHVSFVTPDGLAAGEVANATVALTPLGAAPQNLAMRLISPGHFVGDGNLAAPGHYELSVNASTGSANPSTTFSFRLRAGKSAKP
jgi:copper transport protein